MSIELLDMAKNFAKIKAGFSRADTFFKSVVTKGQMRFVDGVTKEQNAVLQRNPNPSPSAFGGKTFNGRKG